MMKRRIHDFDGFLNEMNGYGDEPFFFADTGDQCNYFFKIEDEEGGHRGFVIEIGKFSQFTQPSEAKNAYAVLGITELSESDLDQAVIDKGEFEPNSKSIDADNKVLSMIMETLTQAVEHYLKDDPKVNKFYDEMPNKINSDVYQEKLKDAMVDWPGEWSFQEIEKGKLNLISK